MQEVSAKASRMREIITVIITTSPSPVQPDTDLLDQTLQSMSAFTPELTGVRVIVVCDGCKTSDKNMFRSARVTENARANYEEYKSRLRDAFSVSSASAGNPQSHRTRGVAAPFKCETLELVSNYGFGFAVREALSLVETPLVCVIQHDRTFVRNVDLHKISEFMLEHPNDVGYVLIPTKSTCNYVIKQQARLLTKGVPRAESNIDDYAVSLPEAGQRLLPCLTWFDSTHICHKDYYMNFIYSQREGLVKKGGFIEGELGQIQFPEFCAQGVPTALKRWRTYLYDDGDETPIVCHLNGQRYQSWEQLNDKYGAFGTGRVGRRLILPGDESKDAGGYPGAEAPRRTTAKANDTDTEDEADEAGQPNIFDDDTSLQNTVADKENQS